MIQKFLKSKDWFKILSINMNNKMPDSIPKINQNKNHCLLFIRIIHKQLVNIQYHLQIP